ncbi:MAG: hypothetical protein IJ506_07055 [Clostridia bacterium]|nr:hypothetical protein [Clostridia bacterium]
MAKKSNSGLTKMCAFWAIIISAALFLLGGFLGGTISAILNLVGKIALAIAVAFPALDYASGKGLVWRVIFWIALAVYLFGCIWSFI